jgi:Methyltransferase domain
VATPSSAAAEAMATERVVRDLVASRPRSRSDVWERLIEAGDVRKMAEVGVFRGAFAASILASCPGIARYYMIDPWRKLEGWNKPLNISDEKFEAVCADALEITAPWEEKRVVLRGTTTEVIDRIPDGELDLAYVDADHTLRGIAIDLIACYPKVRLGGWIGGDDFSPSIWQHSAAYEPSMVFPFAVHFAEAVAAPIFALPHDQFLIEKRAESRFELHDPSGEYADLSLVGQLRREGDVDETAAGHS